MLQKTKPLEIELYTSDTVFSFPHAMPYDKEETMTMKDRAGTSPKEKLLGNKLPVTLSKGDSGNIAKMMLNAMKHTKSNNASLIPTLSL
ncbi:hypothetical protein JCM15124A_07350 [Prevotella falsenii]